MRGLAPVLRLLLASCLAATSASAAITDVAYPPGATANIINVVTAHGATGNDTTDDTAAFEAAISAALNSPDRYSAIKIIYVPNGTYYISRTLQNRIAIDGAWDTGNRWRAGFHLQGESQSGTIIRLANSATGFGDVNRPKPVIQTGSENPKEKLRARVTSLTRSGTVATAVSAYHNLAVGMSVSITGASDANYNGIKTVAAVPDANTFTYTIVNTAAAAPTGTIRFIRLVSSLTRSGGTVATVTYPNHGFAIGDQVIMSGATETYFNKGAYITSVTPNTFTYSVANGADATATGWIIFSTYTDGELNEAFRHYIRNLTVDVGSGNPGAIGIDYICNNRGGIYDVIIKSSDTNKVGYAGIAMDREWPGPALIKNVRVIGFDTGITMINQAQYGMLLENVSLENQRVLGIKLGKNTLTARKLKSVNTVPVIQTTNPTATDGDRAHLSLLDCAFSGATSGTAISGRAKTYIRNLTSTGYTTVLDDQGTNNRDIAGNSPTSTPKLVAEHFTYGVNEEFAASIDGSIRLPVEETPEHNTLDFTKWTAVPAPTGSDDLAGIQTAINTGNEIVYFRQGVYSVSDTIVVSGNVRKIIGLCAGLKPTASFPADGRPLIRFTGAGADATILQYLRIIGDIEHDSARTLAIVNCDFSQYRNTTQGTGKVHFEDVIGFTVNIPHPQSVWARQLNLEIHYEDYNGYYYTQTGGRAWLLGYKTEGSLNSRILYNDASWIELQGGFFYVTNSGPASTTSPMIVNLEGNLSANYKVADTETRNFSVHVRDTRAGVTSDFTSSEVANGRNCTLYSGALALYPANGSVEIANDSTDGTVLADAVRYTRVLAPELIIDNNSATQITTSGSWLVGNAAGAPGFHGTNYLHDNSANKSLCFARYTPNLAATSTYNVYAKWSAYSNRSSAVPYQIRHADGTSVVYVNQKGSTGGNWVLLGAYRFQRGQSGFVEISNQGTTDYVVADGVRFVDTAATASLTIDNADPTKVALIGAWTAATSPAGYQGSNYVHDGNAGQNTKSVVFSPGSLAAGTYVIDTWWPGADITRATNAAHIIMHGFGSSTTLVNQRVAPPAPWQNLGTFEVEANP